MKIKTKKRSGLAHFLNKHWKTKRYADIQLLVAAKMQNFFILTNFLGSQMMFVMVDLARMAHATQSGYGYGAV